MKETNQGTYIITVPIVLKNFMKKNGAITNQGEWYLRRSIQDYYIKFCESAVDRMALEQHLEGLSGMIKAPTLEVEFREGYWDLCDPAEMHQSRVGDYVVVHRIVADGTE